MNDPTSAPSGFAELIGTQWLNLDPDGARASITVTDDHKQPYGIVHGGVYAALAESLCSAATAAAVMGDGMIAIGQSNSTTFLRPITEGQINATARARHRGRTTWVWDVEITDGDGRVCALVRMTAAVRPQK